MKLDNTNIGSFSLLYRDEKYAIWDNTESKIITFSILPWRLNLVFGYEEWEQLKDTVAGIELPDALSEEAVLLCEGEAHVFLANHEFFVWHLTNRMISFAFDIEDWEGFRAAVTYSGKPMFSDYIPPWTVVVGGI